MNKQITLEHKTRTSSRRIIGSLQGSQQGPLMILLTGLHGNESAGVKAVEEVVKILRTAPGAFRGNLLALRANLKALQHDVRYIDEDMNRIWFPSIIRQIRDTPERKLTSSERIETKRLLHILDQVENNSAHPTILADIHTFSAEGSMFTLPNKNSDQLRLLSQMYAPMVLGIGRSLRGTALKYYHNRGMFSFALEGGQHENNLTRQNILASIMLLMQAAGCIDMAEYHTELVDFREHLKSQTYHLPAQTEFVYRHMIEKEDDFEMRPGFKNFQPVKKGEWLATDREGKITALCDGYILMPLYQDQGEDGFFIIKEVAA